MQNGCGGLLRGIDCNLIDKVWGNSRPPLPCGALRILGEEYSGESTASYNALVSSIVTGQIWQEKVKIIRREMQENKASILVITALDEVACELYPCEFQATISTCVCVFVLLA